MEVEGAPAEDRCAEHPDRPAVACSRCGTFVCEACRVEGASPALCATCQGRLEGGRFVSQVPLFGIALMVHGGLVVALGGMLAVYGAFLARAFDRAGPSAAPSDPAAAMMPEVLVGGMLGVGLVHVGIGAFQLFAGWRVRQYRARWLTLGALAAGLGTVIGCYCVPSSIGMLIWGAIVLLTSDVVARFELEKGVVR